jgi:hypothetical protein
MSSSKDWKPAGINGQPSAEELSSRHTQNEPSANLPRPHPGLPLPGISGPNGVRIARDLGDWRQRVRGKRKWTQFL